jgi:hypothetical protein
VLHIVSSRAPFSQQTFHHPDVNILGQVPTELMAGDRGYGRWQSSRVRAEFMVGGYQPRPVAEFQFPDGMTSLTNTGTAGVDTMVWETL